MTLLFPESVTTSSCTPVPEMGWHLPVGVAIGLLGLIAALYPIIGDPMIRRFEKAERPWPKRIVLAVWIFVFIGFAALELHFIKIQEAHQDEQHTYEMCVQDARFTQTINGLNQNLRTEEKTLSGVDAAVTGIKTNIGETTDALNMFTGHDSFPYFDFNDPEFRQGYAKKIGRYPVSDVSVTFYTGDCGNQEGLGSCRYVRSLGSKTFSEINDFLPTPPPAAKYSRTQGIPFTLNTDSGPVHLAIASITARNGLWREFIVLTQVKRPDGYPLNERDIRMYQVLRDARGRPNGRDIIRGCRTMGMPESLLGFDLIDEANVRVYGKPIHLLPSTEGGIAKSGIVFKKPQDCD